MRRRARSHRPPGQTQRPQQGTTRKASNDPCRSGHARDAPAAARAGPLGSPCRVAARCRPGRAATSPRRQIAFEHAAKRLQRFLQLEHAAFDCPADSGSTLAAGTFGCGHGVTPACKRKSTLQRRGSSIPACGALVRSVASLLDFDPPHAILNHLVIRDGARACDRLGGLLPIVPVDHQQGRRWGDQCPAAWRRASH